MQVIYNAFWVKARPIRFDKFDSSTLLLVASARADDVGTGIRHEQTGLLMWKAADSRFSLGSFSRDLLAETFNEVLFCTEQSVYDCQRNRHANGRFLVAGWSAEGPVGLTLPGVVLKEEA